MWILLVGLPLVAAIVAKRRDPHSPTANLQAKAYMHLTVLSISLSVLAWWASSSIWGHQNSSRLLRLISSGESIAPSQILAPSDNPPRVLDAVSPTAELIGGDFGIAVVALFTPVLTEIAAALVLADPLLC